MTTATLISFMLLLQSISTTTQTTQRDQPVNEEEDVVTFSSLNTTLGDGLIGNLSMRSTQGFFQKFQRISVINSFIRDLANRFKPLVSIERIGSSFEGRDIILMRITSNSGANKPIFFMDGGFHSREWLSPSTVLFFAQEISSQYKTNKRVQRLLNTWDFRIIPVANPDGYEYSHTKNRMWRKTRSKIPGSKCRGVDPNRNFNFHWKEGHSSSNPCHEDYAGPKPFSEPETIAFSNYILKLKGRIKIYTGVHTYSQVWLTPWGYGNKRPRNHANITRAAQVASEAAFQVNKRRYKVENSFENLFPIGGSTDDWSKARGRVPYVYTVELPPSSENDKDFIGSGFIADKGMIIPVGKEMFHAFITLAEQVELMGFQ